MIRLTTGTLGRLRQRLRDQGMRPSIAIAAGASPDDALAAELADRYGPLCEAMYVMMAADGDIAGVERDVMRGALRELDERIRSPHVEAMLSASANALAAEGFEARVAAIAQEIGDDRVRGEAAFVLAAAVALADDQLVQVEKQVLNLLSTALGIDPARASELFDSLEKVDTLLRRDTPADAADVMLHTAARVHAPEDFERLAAQTNRSGVRLVLRMYAAFVRSGEDMRDRGATPRSESAARVQALMTLVESFESDVSPNAGPVRAALARVAQSLAEIDTASDLGVVVKDGLLGALMEAIAHLARLVREAHQRCGEAVTGAPPTTDLASVAQRAASGDAKARASLDPTLFAFLGEVRNALPASIADTVALVLERLPEMTASAAPAPATAPAPAPPKAPSLPEWIPAKRTLGGFYVHHQLGKGGTASVFVVVRSDERDEPNAEHFALKVPEYDATIARSVSEAEFLKLFREEAGALLSLPEHPNLARFITFDAGARPKPALVMELIEGATCAEMIPRGLTTARALQILDDVLAGLGAMHGAGLGHLDLKPANVVLRGGVQAVLVDFGLAGRNLRPGCATGSYGAPEVWGLIPDGATPTPMAADIYSVACIAFELFTGRTLFAGSSEEAVISAHLMHDGQPPGIASLMADARFTHVANILAHCLRRDLRHRPDARTTRQAFQNIAPHIAGLPWPFA